MHRSTIGTNDERGSAKNGCEFQKIGTITPVLDVARPLHLNGSKISSPDDHNTKGRGACSKGPDHFRRETLSLTTGIRMHHHIRLLRRKSLRQPSLRQLEFGTCGTRYPQKIKHGEIPTHGMISTVYDCPFSMQQTRSLAGIGEPHDTRGSGKSGKQGAPQQSLQIDRQIGLPIGQDLQPGQRADPSPRPPEFFTGKKQCSGDPRMMLHQRAPCRVNEPAQLGFRPVPMDGRDNRKRMDHITERTRLD